MSCFLLLFNLDYCLHETLSSLERLSFTLHIIFPLVPLQKSCALRDNCLVYITSLVSNNYLGSNNCSVENKFHLLVNPSCFLLLFSLDFCLYETLSSLECLSLHFTRHFPPCSYFDNSLEKLSRFKQVFCCFLAITTVLCTERLSL